MEGTWGRRVFGTIKKGPTETIFELSLETREGFVIGSTILVENQDLEELPYVYKDVLDMMVIDIQRALAMQN